VTSTGSYIGSVVGNNYGTLKNIITEVNVIGNWYVGGLVGTNADTGIIIDSISSGNVQGSECVGGVAGATAAEDSIMGTSSKGQVISSGQIDCSL